MAEKRQAEFLAGRLHARMALSHLGQDHADIPIGPDRAPVWPTGIAGSLSHSYGQCCCLLTSEASRVCGVDIEAVAAGTALEAIEKRCLSHRERAWVDAQHDMPANVMATLLFSAKETIYKAYRSRVGRFFGFECAEFVELTDDGVLRLRLTETLHLTLPRDLVIPVSYEVRPGFVLTWIMGSG